MLGKPLPRPEGEEPRGLKPCREEKDEHSLIIIDEDHKEEASSGSHNTILDRLGNSSKEAG